MLVSVSPGGVAAEDQVALDVDEDLGARPLVVGEVQAVAAVEGVAAGAAAEGVVAVVAVDGVVAGEADQKIGLGRAADEVGAEEDDGQRRHLAAAGQEAQARPPAGCSCR